MDTVSIPELTVLLVEPSSVQQEIIRRMLGDAGIALVNSVRNGQEALVRMAADRPDVVLSAYYLEDMTGADLIHRMRATPSLEEIAFMLVSSETDFRQLDPVRQAGTTAILPKPFGREQLDAGLRSTLAYVNADGEDDHFDFETLRVLVVDDTAVARKFIVRLLERLGVQDILQAKDGAEGAAIVQSDYFDLVITDYNMPNMDGRELVSFIRQESNQRSIPVLMVTSEDSGSRLAAVHQAGVSAICDKPFDLNHIQMVIQQLLS